jgi:hypothetical protein
MDPHGSEGSQRKTGEVCRLAAQFVMKKNNDANSLAAEHFRRGLRLLEAGGDIRSEEEVRKDYQRRTLMLILACRFQTNDFVVLIPGIKSGILQINATTITLDTKEFLVLRAIADARQSRGVGAFISSEAIMHQVDRYYAESGLAEERLGPTQHEIRRIILEVRTKISNARFSRDLIETGRPNGYRFSTPFVEVLSEPTSDGGGL